MRNTGMRGYQGYRGKRFNGKRWLVLALILMILVAAAFLIAQRYIVYDTDGSYHFELPWFHHRSEPDTSAQAGLHNPQELEIVIEEPTPAQIAVKELHAQELDSAILAGGMSGAIGALPESINAVAIRLKTADGDLLYPSALPAAIEVHAVTNSSIARGVIAELTGSDYYTIARLSALHDSRFSFAHMTDAAIQQEAYKNNIWYAPDSTFYLAPEKELTREYLASIADEVASLGFDELLFDDFGYPTVGRLSNIKTDERNMTQEEALSLLASNLREALSAYDTKLSVVIAEETILAGSDARSGQDVAQLAAIFDRIYVPTTAERLPALQTALKPYAAELVPILDAAPDMGSYLISS